MTLPIIQKAKNIFSSTSSSTTSASIDNKMSAKYPKTCKAAVLPALKAKLVIKDVEVKEPQVGEVLIKVHACGVCHSDDMVIQGGMGPL
jgi:hypothetical protein